MKSRSFPTSPSAAVRAQRRIVPYALLSGLALLASQPAAALMLDLGNLAGGNMADARGISGDGKVVVGQLIVGSLYRPFRWSNAQGLYSLGSFGFDGSYAYATNLDGRFVVGTAPLVASSTTINAFRWDAGGGFRDLGSLGGSFASASGISDDGSVVVGSSTNATGQLHAFRWTNQGMQDLGSGGARGVSGDGRITVGQQSGTAFRWGPASAGTSLGTLGGTSSYATAASRDGAVVVGSSDIASQARHAFRWTVSGGLQDLGTLGGSTSLANDVSADGAVVVGEAFTADGLQRAFRWSSAGMADLGVLSGTASSVARGVSDDGSTVVGLSGNRAFIWNGALQDLANLQASIVGSADSVKQLTSIQTRRLRDLSQQQCLPSATQRFCLGLDASGYRGEADSNGGQRNGQLAGGLRINEQFAVGATAASGRADLREQHAEQRHAFALGVWATFQQNPDNTGWGASASAAAGDSNNRVERGLGLSDVQRAQARLDVNSATLRVAANYGMPMGASLITPEIALSHVRSEQDGFTERNVAFPLTVNGSNSQETYATLGVRSATPVSAKGTLHLSLAVDTLLNENTPAIQGSSDVPGFSTFRLNDSLDRRRAVPVAMVGYSHAIDANSTLGGGVQVASSTYQGEQPIFGLGVQYRYAF